MNIFKRARKILLGMGMIIGGFLFLLIPEAGYQVLIIILSISLLVYGVKTIIYYFTMARNMVGGKSALFKSIILLDTAMLTASFSTLRPAYLILYLVGMYAVSGVINILRSAEAKKFDSPMWKMKLASGIINILIAVIAMVFGLFLHSAEMPVYLFAGVVINSGVFSIAGAFQKEKPIYIP